MHPSIEQPRKRESFAGVGIGVGERAARVRSGEREPISKWIRGLVHRRDGWSCQHCGATPYARDEHRRSGELHVDHIVPWSAGGSNRTDNLRTLCWKCNMARSNFIGDNAQPRLPIVRVCGFCLTHAHAPAGVETIDVYCACHSHESWALPGWAIL